MQQELRNIAWIGKTSGRQRVQVQSPLISVRHPSADVLWIVAQPTEFRL